MSALFENNFFPPLYPLFESLIFHPVHINPKSQFLAVGEIGKLASGKVSGNTLKLTLTAPSNGSQGSQKMLRGANGPVPQTCCKAPISAATP